MKPSYTHLRIGDTEPCPFRVDRDLLATVNRRRGRIAAMAEKGGTSASNWFQNQAQVIMNDHRARRDRMADPFERAREFLQQRGYVVFGEGIETGRASRWWQVGSKRLRYDEVLAFARERGWGE